MTEKTTIGGTVPHGGGMTNNMPPQNPQAEGVEIPFWCGVDWLKLNFQVRFLRWTELHENLNRFSAVAMEQKKAVETNDLGGAIMQPGGGYIGKGTGKRGKYCKYRMTMPWGAVVVAEAEQAKGNWPNVQINIPGEICLTYPGGAFAAYADCFQWLESISGEIKTEKISRVDFCADFPGWNMKPFVAAYLRRKWLCKAKTQRFAQSNAMSLYFGTHPLMLRIYDKLAEMEASTLRGEPVKFEHMIQKRWGGKLPDSAIRIEYQVGRDKLKGWGIDTVDDLRRVSPSIMGYLTGSGSMRWFMFMDKRNDPKHPERNEPSKAWKTVQDVFASVFGVPEELINIEAENADVEALIKQAFGVLEAAAWNKGYRMPNRPINSETKYHFSHYEDFEHWFSGMLRNVALEKPGHRFRPVEKHRTTIDDQIEEMESRKMENE